jgi:hypothetical protein
MIPQTKKQNKLRRHLIMSLNRKTKRIAVVLAAIVVMFMVMPAGADWLQRSKLLASDGTNGDVFGYSVSISGDFAIVGIWTSNGSAYIFTPDDIDPNNWVQQAKLTAIGGSKADYFGHSVSISGDFAVVGAYCDDDKGSGSGSAYIFKRDGVTWSQQAKLLASDGAGGDEFGWAVSIGGDYALIVARNDRDNGGLSGSAYIFKREGTNWVQQQKLLASDGAASDEFGSWSVSINGDLAIIGARCDDDKGSNSGSTYIFRHDGERWVELPKLLADDGEAGDAFGHSTSICDDYAIIGAPYSDDAGSNSGSVYIFAPNDIDPNNWVQRQKLTASDANADDNFGWSVSISGDYAIICARQDDEIASNAGAAYIFKRVGESWVEQQKLLASDGAASDCMGWSVSISGDKAIAGAPYDDGWLGSAYLFERTCPISDLSGDDCCVNFVDFAILGSQWFQAPGFPSADIAPEGGDDVVNSLDLDVMTDEWLQCGE